RSHPRWPQSRGVSYRRLDVAATGPPDSATPRDPLSSRPCVAPVGPARLQLSAAQSPGVGTQRGRGAALAPPALAGPQKKARREGRTIVFVDESGLSTRPHRVRTWGRRGQTPVLQETFNWQSLSLIAGLTLWRFYFRAYA